MVSIPDHSLKISGIAHVAILLLMLVSIPRCSVEMNDAKPPQRLDLAAVEPPPQLWKKVRAEHPEYDPYGPPGPKRKIEPQVKPPPEKKEVAAKPEPAKPEPPKEKPPEQAEPAKVEAKKEPPPPEKPAEKPVEKPQLAALPPPMPPPPVKPPPPPKKPRPPARAEQSLDADFLNRVTSTLSAHGASVGGGTGARPDSNETLGMAGGTALTATDLSRLRARIQQCWNPPVNLENENISAVILAQFNRDGSLRAQPKIVERSDLPGSDAFASSAMQAIVRCAPYSFLPPAKYDSWESVEMGFTLKDLLYR